MNSQKQDLIDISLKQPNMLFEFNLEFICTRHLLDL